MGMTVPPLHFARLTYSRKKYKNCDTCERDGGEERISHFFFFFFNLLYVLAVSWREIPVDVRYLSPPAGSIARNLLIVQRQKIKKSLLIRQCVPCDVISSARLGQLCDFPRSLSVRRGASRSMQKELRARLQRAAVYLDPFMGWPSDDAQHSCSGRDLDDALRPQWLRARQQLRVVLT